MTAPVPAQPAETVPAPPAAPVPARPAAPVPARPAATVPARPAATVLLVRDGVDGLEVFMVLRNRQIEFAAGALVFPGGRVEAADAELATTLAPADQLAPFRVAAVREAFEECGVLLARDRGGAPVTAAAATRLGERRGALCAGQVSFAALLAAEGLVADVAALAHFAHWVTPVDLAKRFDTHFFLAADPGDQSLLHDGDEAVDSIWITPQAALADAAAGIRTVVFPTRLTLARLGRAHTVREAFRAALAAPVVTVMPEFVELAAGPHMRIPLEAGYGGPLFPAGRRAM